MRAVPALAVLVCCGCALGEPRYAYVDSVAAPDAPTATTYYLISAIRGLDLDAPELRRFRDMAHEAMATAGFTRVESVKEAELVVTFAFGVTSDRGDLVTERTSYANLTAFDWEAVSAHDARNAAWVTRAYMDGADGGLGLVVGLLLEAAAPHIGGSTGDALLVRVR